MEWETGIRLTTGILLVHGRFPLLGASPEDFRGIVYVPALFARLDELRSGEITLEEVAHPPMTVEASASIAGTIDRFQQENQELALVTDGDRVVGLVTSTDLFEEITGELEDPLDLEMREG